MLETIEVDTNMAMNMNNSKEFATYREIGDAGELEGNYTVHIIQKLHYFYNSLSDTDIISAILFNLKIYLLFLFPAKETMSSRNLQEVSLYFLFNRNVFRIYLKIKYPQ